MSSKISGIYAIVHCDSGKKYIGSAVNIQKRWTIHRHGLNNKKHHSAVLQKAWEKYGSEAFSFVILETVENKLDLLKIEQYWLDATKCFAPNGFNLCPTAGSSLGRRFSDESKAKMSAIHKGKKISDEAKRKMSLAGKGVPKSDAHKKAMSDGQKGRVISEKTRAAVAMANSKRVYTDEMREKRSTAMKMRYQKLRAAQAGYQVPEVQSDGQVVYRGKP